MYKIMNNEEKKEIKTFEHDAEMAYHAATWKTDYVDFKTDKVLMTYQEAVWFTNFYMHLPIYKKVINRLHAKASRYNRLLKRIMSYLECGTCWFVTLTWRDDVLEKTEELTRRKYVRRWLKSISKLYIANIDFGGKTDREHYHAVVLAEDPEIFQTWKHGFINVQQIRYDKKSAEKISHYVIKLTNHAVKDTTKNRRVIYSVYRDLWKYVEKVDPEVRKEKIDQLKLWNIVPGDIDL